MERFSGQRVEVGDLVFKLDDEDQQLRYLDLQQVSRRADAQLKARSWLRKHNTPMDIDLRATESSAKAALDQAERAAEAAARMSITAQLPGKLISLPAPKLHDVNGRNVTHAAQLWLDPDQCGRLVPAGTMLAAVCSRQLLAVIPLQDLQLRDIHEGTAVRLFVPSHSSRVWDAQVQAIVRLDELDATARLIATQTADGLQNVPPQATPEKSRTGYAAVIELPFQDASINCDVQASFTVTPKTLAARASDWAHSNLRWLID